MTHSYGDKFLSDEAVRKWYRKFKDGKTGVHDKEGQVRKSDARKCFVQ